MTCSGGTGIAGDYLARCESDAIKAAISEHGEDWTYYVLEEKNSKQTINDIRQQEIDIGLMDRDNLDIRVDWINALRTIVSRRLPKNKSGMSLISDIDLMLADDDERTEALEKIKTKYKL